MGPGPPITAMAIADAIFDEIRNSGTDVKKPESTCPHGVAPHPQLPRSNTKTKRTKPKRRRRRRRASVPTVDRTPRHSLTSSRVRSRAPLAVTDRQLELLAFVFDAKHLENSLVMYQKRAVKKTRRRQVRAHVLAGSGQVRGEGGVPGVPDALLQLQSFSVGRPVQRGAADMQAHARGENRGGSRDDYNVARLTTPCWRSCWRRTPTTRGTAAVARGGDPLAGAGAGTAGGGDEAAHDHAR